MKFPGSVLVSLVLFLSEMTAALCLSVAYRAAGDRMWHWLTLLFALLPCALVQLSLVFIHRDVSRDRPLVLLLHLLQLGPLVRSLPINLGQFVEQKSCLPQWPGCDPQDAGMPETLQRLGWNKVTAGFWASWGIPAAFQDFHWQTLLQEILLALNFTTVGASLSSPADLLGLHDMMNRKPLQVEGRTVSEEQVFAWCRCVEAFCIYFHAGRVEDPYVSITKKWQVPKDGYSEEIEKEVGQAEHKLCVHRSAFSRASVIQAFLGSAPQLTLQLYICIMQQEVTAARSTFMMLSLLSIVYGALRCNILAIKIKYDDYDVRVKPVAYLCIFLWRSLEIATRVTVLVLFSSVLQIWTLPVVLVNFLGFCFYPWILFWHSKSPFPEIVEKEFSRVGTTIVLCLLTFLYAGINMFCWSAVQVELSVPDLISKSQNWTQMTVYYVLRLVENAFLLMMWYIYRTDIYLYVCAPLLFLRLLLCYCMAVFFMLVFYQFCHPCKKLFSSSITEALLTCSKFLCFSCKSPKSAVLTDKAVMKSPENSDETRSSGKTMHSQKGNPHQSVSSNA